MRKGGVGELNREQLDLLAQHFNETVEFTRHIGLKDEGVEPGRAVLYLDTEEYTLTAAGACTARSMLPF